MANVAFHIRTNRKGETFFVIVGGQGEKIAPGEGCKNLADVEQTIATLKREIADAPIIDKRKHK